MVEALQGFFRLRGLPCSQCHNPPLPSEQTYGALAGEHRDSTRVLSRERREFCVTEVTPPNGETIVVAPDLLRPCNLSSVRTDNRKRGIMHKLTDSKTPRLPIRAILSALLVAGYLHAAPALSDDGTGVATAGRAAVLAEAATPEVGPAKRQTLSKNTPSIHSPEDSVEVRIRELHKKLKITAAQEAEWNHFAEVMRDNAQTVDGVLKERSENLHTMSAVDDLRSYEKLADAHADGLKKLVPAFETLYNTMSEDQKKTADVVFAKHEKRPQHASSK